MSGVHLAARKGCQSEQSSTSKWARNKLTPFHLVEYFWNKFCFSFWPLNVTEMVTFLCWLFSELTKMGEAFLFLVGSISDQRLCLLLFLHILVSSQCSDWCTGHTCLVCCTLGSFQKCWGFFSISFPEDSVAVHEFANQPRTAATVMSAERCHSVLLPTECCYGAWKAWLSRAPLWHACSKRVLLIQGFSADRLPHGPRSPIFSLFIAQSVKLLCSITKMFKEIFAAVRNFFPLAYSFYSCPDKVWLVTHLASK